ncbi:MAG TPA: hypothetical protein V6C89_18695 [Drouetiella sp.]|jgi:hypothetical protein
MRFRVLNTLAGSLAVLSVLLWTPFSNWFIEIFSPTTKLFVLNAFLLTASVVLFNSTSSQSRKKRVALRTVAVFVLIAGSFSLLPLWASIISEPLYAFGWNSETHNILVGSHHIEARRTGLFDLSSGSGEIVVREVKPLSTKFRLVRQPIAVDYAVTGVDLRKIDNNSFSYQFVGDDVDYPVCTVHFNN